MHIPLWERYLDAMFAKRLIDGKVDIANDDSAHINVLDMATQLEV